MLIMPHFRAIRPATPWTPLSLGAKLDLYLGQDSARFTDVARTTPCSSVTPGTTDRCASWTDLSPNANHATQSTSGTRTGWRSAGGISLSGTQWMVTGSSLPLIAGDATVVVVFSLTSAGPVGADRIVESSHDYAYLLYSTGSQIRSTIRVAENARAQSYGTLYRARTHRLSTTSYLSVNGDADTTQTVPGTDLLAYPLHLGTDAATKTRMIIGTIREVIVAHGLDAGERTSLDAWLAAQSYA